MNLNFYIIFFLFKIVRRSTTRSNIFVTKKDIIFILNSLHPSLLQQQPIAPKYRYFLQSLTFQQIKPLVFCQIEWLASVCGTEGKIGVARQGTAREIEGHYGRNNSLNFSETL